jgi:hypothetical protein
MNKKLQAFSEKLAKESIGLMQVMYRKNMLIATNTSAIFAFSCIVPKKLVLVSKRLDWQENEHTEIHEVTPELLTLIFSSMVNKSGLETYRLTPYEVNNKIKELGYYIA